MHWQNSDSVAFGYLTKDLDEQIQRPLGHRGMFGTPISSGKQKVNLISPGTMGGQLSKGLAREFRLFWGGDNEPFGAGFQLILPG